MSSMMDVKLAGRQELQLIQMVIHKAKEKKERV